MIGTSRKIFGTGMSLSLIFLLLLAVTGCGRSSENSSASLKPPSGISTISGKVTLSRADGMGAGSYLVTAYQTDRQSKPGSKGKGTAQLSDGAYQTTTDSTGHFEMNLPYGEYNLFVEGPNSRKALKQLRAFTSAISVDIVLTATGDVKGRLVQNGNPIGYSTGVFIPGTSFIAITDADGNFTLSGVPVGSYLLQTDWGPSSGTISVTVTIGTTNIGDFDMGANFDKPTVLSTTPYAGETTDRFMRCINNCFSGHAQPFGISLFFSQEMDLHSVKNATTITTPGNIEIQWDYHQLYYYGPPVYPPSPNNPNSLPYYRSPGSREVGIHPASREDWEKLSPGTYTVSISATALTVDGVPLGKPVSFSFTLVEDVIGTKPTNGEQDVHLSLHDGIGIAFSNRMDQESVIIDIEPPIIGQQLEWDFNVQEENGQIIGPSGFQFVNVSGLFADNVTYTVNVTSGKTLSGTDLSGLPHTFSFKTSAPEVVEAFPLDGATDVPKSSNMTIRFNTVVDRDLVEGGLVVEDGTTRVTGVKSKWIGFGPDTCVYCYAENFQPNDSLVIDFPKSYGKTYTISLTGMKTPEGTPLPNFTTSFTTLSPRIIRTDPAKNGLLSFWGDPIRLIANVPVDRATVTTDNIKLQDSSGTPVPIIVEQTGLGGVTCDPYGFCSSTDSGRVILIRGELKASNLYTVIATGLTAEDDKTPLPDITFSFTTARRGIVWSTPERGEVGVYLDHRVVVGFNDRFNADEQALIEGAIQITAQPKKDGRVSYPAPAFLWGTWGQGFSQLFINFTFNPGTNYKIWSASHDTTTGNLLPTKEIKDSLGNTILFVDRYLEFTTLDSSDVLSQLPNLVFSFSPRDGSLDLDPGEIELEVVFGTLIVEDRNVLKLFEGTTKVDLSTAEVQFSSESRYGFPCENGSYPGCTTDRFVTVLRVRNSPLRQNNAYRVEITGALPRTDCPYIIDCGGEVQDNLPFVSSFTTAGPRLFVGVDNLSGEIRIGGSGTALIDTAALKKVLKTSPAVICTWDFDTIDSDPDTDGVQPPAHLVSAICSYPPIVYANMKVEIGALNAFIQGVNSITGAVFFIPVGKFVNTPLSEVFYINPNITLPVLETVEVFNNLPGTEATLHLMFNEFMEASTVTTGAFTLTDNATSNTLTIKSIQSVDQQHQPIEGARWAGPAIHLTTDPLEPGMTYTLMVNGVKEFGGHYTINTAADGTKSFTFNGKVASVLALQTLTYDYNSNEYTVTTKIAIQFTTSMKDDDTSGYKIADQLEVTQYDYHIGATTPLVMTATWGDQTQTLLILEESHTAGYGDGGNLTVRVTAGALNSVGNRLENTPFFEGYLYPRDPNLQGYVTASSATQQVLLNFFPRWRPSHLLTR